MGEGAMEFKKINNSLINDHEVGVSYSSFIAIHCLFLIQINRKILYSWTFFLRPQKQKNNPSDNFF
jgi:hypothetical protein